MSTSYEVLLLPNERKLAYTCYGELDEPQHTTIYCHGLPSSRLEGSFWNNAAKELMIRLVAFDRPGIGRSTYQADRTLLGIADDVAALAKHFGAQRYSVLGCSGGGPYALASAYALPSTHIVSVGVIAGLPPRSWGTEGMGWLNWFNINALKLMPWGLRPWLEYMHIKPLQKMDVEKADEALKKAGQKHSWLVSERERALMEDDGRRRSALAMVKESAQGGVDGLVKEHRILAADWGFKFTDIKQRKVCFWYGTADDICPAGLGKRMADEIQSAEFNTFQEEGHSESVMLHCREVLLALIS